MDRYPYFVNYCSARCERKDDGLLWKYYDTLRYANSFVYDSVNMCTKDGKTRCVRLNLKPHAKVRKLHKIKFF